MTALPLVSIGIPTYNRAESLQRAVRSAFEQTYRNVEIIIADNASGDATPSVCAAFAAEDPRVRVVRRSRNIGPVANFNATVAESAGEYVLVLADDDWLAPDYVEDCLARLLARPQLALVCGRALYYSADGLVGRGVSIQLDDPRPAHRVAAFFRHVYDNATLYGVMRADVARTVYPLPNVIGADWLLVAGIAALGEIETLQTTTISRSTGGASVTLASIAAHTGESAARVRHWHLLIGWRVLRDIGWRSELYGGLGRLERMMLGLRCQPPLVRQWLGACEVRLFALPAMRRARIMRLRRALSFKLDRRPSGGIPQPAGDLRSARKADVQGEP